MLKRYIVMFILLIPIYALRGAYSVSAKEVYTINYYHLNSLKRISQNKKPTEIKNTDKSLSKQFTVDGRLTCWNNIDGESIMIYDDKWFDSERALMLADRDLTIDFLQKKGLKNIDDYLIFHFGTYFNDFNILVDADDGLWVVPILNHEDVCWKYENGKVYSVEEFCNGMSYESPCTVDYIKSISSVIVTANNICFPLYDTLSALVDELIYDKDSDIYTVNGRNLTLMNDTKDPPGLNRIMVSDSNRLLFYTTENNIEYIFKDDLILLMSLLGIKLHIRFDIEKNVVYIITEETEAEYKNAINNTYKLIVSGKEIESYSPIVRYYSKEYIPIRNFAEIIGEEIIWDENKKCALMGIYEFDIGTFSNDYTYHIDNTISRGLINVLRNKEKIRFDCIMINDRLLISREELQHIAAKYNMCIIADVKENNINFENFEEWRRR